jgi:hypothetical protein
LVESYLNTYIQCRLEKKQDVCILEDVVYIPEKLAVVDLTLKIIKNGEWDYGWVVKEIYKDSSKDYLTPPAHFCTEPCYWCNDPRRL